MKKNIWPALIATLGISFLAITGWSIFRAASGVSSVTDPRYYTHGLKYNETSVETQAAIGMGWSITPVLDKNSLKFHLIDANGKDVTGATGSISFHESPTTIDGTSSVPLSLIFTEQQNGWYTVALPKHLPLATTVDVLLSKNQATIRRRVLLNLSPQRPFLR